MKKTFLMAAMMVSCVAFSGSDDELTITPPNHEGMEAARKVKPGRGTGAIGKPSGKAIKATKKIKSTATTIPTK